MNSKTKLALESHNYDTTDTCVMCGESRELLRDEAEKGVYIICSGATGQDNDSREENTMFESYFDWEYGQPDVFEASQEGLNMGNVRAIDVYIDGGCSNNGAENANAYGSVRIIGLDDNTHRLIYKNAHTNNEAEYGALLSALDLLSTLLDERFEKFDIYIRINTDSALVFNQVQSLWKVKSPALRKLCDIAKNAIERFDSSRHIMLRMNQVPREVIASKLGH